MLLLTRTVRPIRFAAAWWRAGAESRERTRHAGWMTLSLALLAPVVFVVGLVAAQAAQPGPDPHAQSLSALAGHAATARWIMTTTLLVIGATYVLVAAGLRRLPTAPRLLLGLGGAMLLVVALAPQPAGGSSAVHMASGSVAWAAFVAWPLALACSRAVDDGLRWTSALASGVHLVLVVWFAVQLFTGGSWYGVSEWTVSAAQSVWPIRVAAAEVTRSMPIVASPRARRT